MMHLHLSICVAPLAAIYPSAAAPACKHTTIFLIVGAGVYHNDLVAAISFIYARAARSPNEQYVLVVSDSQIVNSCYHIIDDAMVTYPENLKIGSATNDLNIWFRGLRIAHTHFHLSDIDTDAIKSAQAVSQFVTMG